MKSKEGKNEFESNELSIQNMESAIEKHLVDNPTGLWGSLQRTSDRESASLFVIDELLDFCDWWTPRFWNRDGTFKVLSYDVSPNSGSSKEISLPRVHLCLAWETTPPPF